MGAKQPYLSAPLRWVNKFDCRSEVPPATEPEVDPGNRLDFLPEQSTCREVSCSLSSGRLPCYRVSRGLSQCGGPVASKETHVTHASGKQKTPRMMYTASPSGGGLASKGKSGRLYHVDRNQEG